MSEKQQYTDTTIVEKKTLHHCSWCGIDQNNARRMVANGDETAFICDVCLLNARAITQGRLKQ